MLDAALQGSSTTLFAYGGSGSGKSHAMFGSSETAGLVPRLCKEVFNLGADSTIQVECSMLEICNEDVRDLLSSEGGLTVMDHAVLGPYVPNLSQSAVHTYEALESTLNHGIAMRAVGETASIATTASRAHVIFQLVLTQTRSEDASRAVITLVDLAGSCGAFDEEDTMADAVTINQGLSALDDVVRALAAGRTGNSVPFQSSKLTHLLQGDFEGKAKVSLLATVSPAAAHYQQTVRTLEFAQAMGTIQSHLGTRRRTRNELIHAMETEIGQLREAAVDGGGDTKQQLANSERVVQELAKSWDERLSDTNERIKRREQLFGERMGIVKQHDPRLDTCAHLLNLSADPALNEHVAYFLNRPSTLIGKFQLNGSNSSNNGNINSSVDVAIGNVEIAPEHCRIRIDIAGETIPDDDLNIPYFDSTKHTLSITALPGAKVFVNGTLCTESVTLAHLDRVVFGCSGVFKVVLPQVRAPKMLQDVSVNWAFAMKELDGALLQQLLLEGRQHTIQSNELVKVVEAEINGLRERMAEQHEVTQEQELDLRNRTDRARTLKRAVVWQELGTGLIEKHILDIISLVQVANGIAEAMAQAVKFTPKLVYEGAEVSASSAEDTCLSKVCVSVVRSGSSDETLWGLEKFVTRVHLMCRMYTRWNMCNRDVDAIASEYTDARNPFVNHTMSGGDAGALSSHCLIGRATVYLTSLIFMLHIDMKCALVDYDGHERGQVHVRVRVVKLGDTIVDKYDTLPNEEHNSSSRGGRANSYRADVGGWSAQPLDSHMSEKLVIRVEVVVSR
jgi:pSer/pThr/pTyr-binding forkhead associated (FHA) protein